MHVYLFQTYSLTSHQYTWRIDLSKTEPFWKGKNYLSNVHSYLEICKLFNHESRMVNLLLFLLSRQFYQSHNERCTDNLLVL